NRRSARLAVHYGLADQLASQRVQRPAGYPPAAGGAWFLTSSSQAPYSRRERILISASLACRARMEMAWPGAGDLAAFHRAHFQRKCTNSRPWFLESFSTR